MSESLPEAVRETAPETEPEPNRESAPEPAGGIPYGPVPGPAPESFAGAAFEAAPETVPETVTEAEPTPARTVDTAVDTAVDPADAAAAERESWFERDADQAVVVEGFDPDEDVVPELEGPADPQAWLDQLADELRRAEQGGFGGGPREALSARIRLAQAYSELGDSMSAAPLAVRNAAQAAELFPSSERMLAQLRDFRDAACEAAGWTAAMMRSTEPEPEPVRGENVEPGAVPVAGPIAEPVVESATEPGIESPIDAPIETPIETDVEPAPEPPLLILDAPAEPMLIDELTEAPGVIVIAAPRDDIEDAEEIGAVGEFDETLRADDASGVDLAAYEEIVRLRYELHDALRTIDRLRHVNRKLREALDYEG